MANKVTLKPSKTFNRIVAKQSVPGIRAEADRIKDRAEARLAEHHRTGKSSISVEHGRIDSFVSLNDKAAASIEFGHFGGYKGKRKFVPGLYVLHHAAGLI